MRGKLVTGVLIIGLFFGMGLTVAEALLPTVPVKHPVYLGNQPLTGEEQKALLAAQEWLKGIGYNYTPEQVYNLRKLSLQLYTPTYYQQINDQTLVHLRIMKNLEEVLLPRQIGDGGVAYLSGLTKLQNINMPDSRITDQGLKSLAGLVELRTLVLHVDTITNDGLVNLKRLTKLEILGINNAKLTDAGMIYLKDLKSIRKLFLARTEITDKAIDFLVKFDKLDRLNIQGTRITSNGYNILKAALPSCEINF